MTREIKFRAWVKSPVPKMCEITSLNFGWETGTGAEAMVKWFSDKPSQRLHPTEYELMQFTGLKDKNEVDIYESDLIEFGTGEVGEIVWDVENAGFRIKSDLHNIRLEDSNYGKIVGNIYETKGK